MRWFLFRGISYIYFRKIVHAPKDSGFELVHPERHPDLANLLHQKQASRVKEVEVRRGEVRREETRTDVVRENNGVFRESNVQQVFSNKERQP